MSVGSTARVLLPLLGGSWLLGGCGQTDYDLFTALPVTGGDGDSVTTAGGSPSGGETGSTGGQGSASGGGSGSSPSCDSGDACGADTGGAMGLGGALPPPMQCLSESRPGFGLVQLQMQGSGLCVVPGEAITIVGTPAHEVTVQSCEDLPEQYWTVLMDFQQQTWEFRNESLGMNLDIQFGADTTGAPALLYDPHQLYNQRFFANIQDEGMRIRPSNSLDKCLTQVDTAMLLNPCNSEEPNQLIRVIPCVE